MRAIVFWILGLVLAAAIAAGPIGCAFKAHAEASVESWPCRTPAPGQPEEVQRDASQNQ